MPIPSPSETQEEFVSRCIPIVIEDGTAEDQEQAAAICYSMWRDAQKIQQREDVSEADRERAVSEYGNVEFADPKNKKYPLDTEEHIRAAWNYIHQARNRAMYTADELKLIESRIVKAWKKKIDKDGPPSMSKKMICIKTAGDWELDVLAVPYGGPDNGRDAQGEFFTPNTDLELKNFSKPLVVYYHGFDEKKQQMKTPEIIGEVLSHESKADGHWVRILLNKANEYARRVWEAAKKGLAKASSGTISHLARVDWNGEIKYWPLAEITLFDSNEVQKPANAYAVALPVMKALYEKAGIELPEILGSWTPEADVTGVKQSTDVDEVTPEITFEKRMQLKAKAFLIGD